MKILGIEEQVYLDLLEEKHLELVPSYKLVYLVDGEKVKCIEKDKVTLEEIEWYTFKGRLEGIDVYIKTKTYRIFL